MPRRFLNSYRN